MTAAADLAAQLVAALEEQHAVLTAELELVNGRLQLARQLLGDTPAAEPKPTRQVACPDCGQIYPNRHAVDSHRRDAHPRSAAKPVERATKGGRPRKLDYDAIRATCERAQAAGEPMVTAVQREHGLSPSGARNAIQRARQSLTAVPEPVEPPIEWDLPAATRPGDLDPDVVYRCGDCGDELATTESLSNHTYSQHGRPPRMTEKVTVRPKAAA